MISFFLKKNILSIFFILINCLLLLSFQGYSTASMLADFENGNNANDGPDGSGIGFFPHRSDTSVPLPVVSPGALGTNYSVHYRALSSEEKPQMFYISDPVVKRKMDESTGANRMKALIKIDSRYTVGGSRNFHFGTYTRDPNVIIDSNAGRHYYHYFQLPSSDYWHVLIANAHPSHEVSNSSDISDEPTNWPYYDGFTRFYFHLKEYGSKPPGDWSWYADEVQFFHNAEPENDVSINSISASYFGEGHYQINWQGEFRDRNDHHYELRFSTSPITNANYNNSMIAPGCSNLTKVSGAYSWVKADFTVPGFIDGITYYFAIKDLDSSSPYISKIDYPLGVAGSGELDITTKPVILLFKIN